MNGLDYLRQCARPVVFDTGISSVPFSTVGTAFLVGFRKNLFVITARHVVHDLPIDRLLIFPADSPVQPLRLSDWWQVNSIEGEKDCSDILIIRAEVKDIPKAIRRSSHLLHLTPPETSQWFADRYSSLFFVFGYPSVMNEVDYINSEINTQQFFLRGSYVGPSAEYGCHEIQLENPLSLPDFNGLSGSPVFNLRSEIAVPRQPTFCGMALRGTASSKRIHFLDANVIGKLLNEVAIDYSKS